MGADKRGDRRDHREIPDPAQGYPADAGQIRPARPPATTGRCRAHGRARGRVHSRVHGRIWTLGYRVHLGSSCAAVTAAMLAAAAMMIRDGTTLSAATP